MLLGIKLELLQEPGMLPKKEPDPTLERRETSRGSQVVRAKERECGSEDFREAEGRSWGTSQVLRGVEQETDTCHRLHGSSSLRS